MTGEEIVCKLDAENRAVLLAIGDLDTKQALQMLNQASLRGFKLGSETALAMVKGALVVRKAAA